MKTKDKDIAVAYAIETLCIFALADTSGTIRLLIERFPNAIRHVDEITMNTLTQGLGYNFEKEAS